MDDSTATQKLTIELTNKVSAKLINIHIDRRAIEEFKIFSAMGHAHQIASDQVRIHISFTSLSFWEQT